MLRPRATRQSIQARLDSGNLITYLAGGAPYIAIPIGGASQRAELVALRLPMQ